MDKKKLLEIKKELKKKIGVEKMYLYGSRAKGTYTRDSDYDIAIISLDFSTMSFSERQKLVRPLIRKVLGTVSLDVTCYTPEEYRRGKKAFLPSIIEKEGICA